MHPNYTVKKPKLLYIDRNGYVYPDCKTYKSPIIGRIDDDDIINKINKIVFQGNDDIFNMITVELSSACNASCLYCFQNDGRRGKRYEFYDDLKEILPKLKTYWLFFSGGEILYQEDAMNFIREYRQIAPKYTWFHLKTNGNASKKGAEFVEECFDSIMVSFNGFSDATCQNLMRVDISETLSFCDMVKNKTNLCVKFLASPICICEIGKFVDWAVNINAKCIAFQTVYNYSFDINSKCSREEHVFQQLHGTYWDEVLKRSGDYLTYIIEKNKEKFNKETRYLAADKTILDVLMLDENIKKLFRTDGVYLIQ